MASGSIPQTASAAEPRVKADKLIETQLGKVRRHIRITDLIAGMMVLLAGVLAFITVVAVIDHWLVGLGTIGRWLALAVIVVGAGWHLAVNVVPLLVRRINPAYAAQTIERGEPALKNSLLNYLLLPRERDGVPGLIYQAVQQRAAADVSRVEVEQTIDRTVLIRAGYLLFAMMVLAGAYKILSPKDPFQTVRRIATPWADIARPARVSIQSIEPGDAKVFQGQTVELSAIVRGTRSGEPVTVTYSTLDKQLVNRTATMKLDSAGLRHVLTFPPEGDGVQQDLVYHISAGDAVSKTYRLDVSSAPVMTVESVQYEYPAYTRRPPELVERQGDLKAIEGTRVTVRTKANQPIKSAMVEFFGANSDRVDARLPMHTKDSNAASTWTLELAEDRQTPKHHSYQTRFRTQSGAENPNPVLHRIEVIPDLSPELEFLTPAKETSEIAVSASQKIEIRAIDPDYGLTEVRLHATSGGKELLNLPLLQNSAGQAGQAVVTHDFKPKDFNLQPGNRITYWAVASDNRTVNDVATPNTRRTAERTLVIVADPPGQGSAAKNGDSNSAESNQPMPATPEDQQDQSTTGRDAGAQSDQRKPDGSQSTSKDSSKSDERGPSQSDPGSSSKQKNRQSPQAGAKSDEQKSDQQKSEDQKSASQKGRDDSQQGVGGKGSQGGDKDETQKRGGNAGSSQPSTSESGQGANSQNQGGSTPQDSGANSEQPASAGNDSSADGETRGGNPNAQKTEPTHDGEVFEKALERLKREPGSEEQDGAPQDSSADSSEGTDANWTSDPNQKNGGEPGRRETGKEGANAGDRNGNRNSSGTQSNASNAKQPTTDKKGDGSSSAQEKDPNAGTPRIETPADQTSDKPDGSKKDGSAAKTDNQKQDGAADGNHGREGTAGGQPNATKRQDSAKQDTGSTGKKGPDEKSSAESSKGQPEKSSADREKGTSGGPKGNNSAESAGAGDQGKEKHGSGESTPKGERPMNTPPNQGEPTPNDVPPPNQSEKSSNSQGQQSGDRSGGGKQGAGQSAQQPGQDNAGSQSPSESGNDGAQEQGKGDSTRKGNQQEAAGKTGSTGNSKGSGSKSADGASGQKQDAPEQKSGTPNPGAEPQPQAAKQGSGKEGSSKQGSNEQARGKPGTGKPGAPGSMADGGSEGTAGAESASAAEDSAAEAANLEYTRKATDMVLDYLKDQRDKPDSRLLDDLGWTQEDLQNFISRWEQLKKAANEDPAARRELDDTLRGLGLRPQRDQLRRGGSNSDDQRGLRESGIKSAPPAAYQEQFNAFKKGTSRATK